jgi:lipopolysaccharide transport protein LptA
MVRQGKLICGAEDQRSNLHQHRADWTKVALASLIVVFIWVSLAREQSWAQNSGDFSAVTSNQRGVHQVLGGAEHVKKTAVEKKRPRYTDHHLDKSGVAGDSKNNANQTPFASFSGSNRGPISIQSDSLALDYKQNSVHFTGHVHAAQADGMLTSNMLNVKYGKDFHEVQNMTADGNVRISQGVRWCTSDHAVMDQQQHTVILTGSPICHDARDQIAGTRITVHLDTGRSDVEAAKAVIFPQASKTRDNEALADQAK